MKKRLLSLGFAGILCLLSAGCEKSGGVTAVSQDDLIGKWNFSSLQLHTHYVVTVGGKTQSEDMDTTQSLAGQGNFVQFNQDMTASADVPFILLQYAAKRSAVSGIPLTGTWSVAGNMVTLISSDKEDTLAFAAAVSGSSATFSITKETKGTAEGVAYTSTGTSTITASKQP